MPNSTDLVFIVFVWDKYKDKTGWSACNILGQSQTGVLDTDETLFDLPDKDTIKIHTTNKYKWINRVIYQLYIWVKAIWVGALDIDESLFVLLETNTIANNNTNTNTKSMTVWSASNFLGQSHMGGCTGYRWDSFWFAR